MYGRTFTDETTAPGPAPVYVFEGFNIEFSEKLMLTPLTPRSGLATEQSVSYQFALDPDRAGDFIIPDIYPGDLGGNPALEVLPGLVVDAKEVVGCVVKAGEGAGWDPKFEAWFRRVWPRVREVAGDRYGVDFFRGCYHYLRFTVDGTRQANYFCDQVDVAGGWGAGDLMPWLDIEEAGQGAWAPQVLETINDDSVRQRLANEVTTCATAFIRRFKERTGLRIAIYGRKLSQDLRIADGKFGADSVVNPAYTFSMPRMDGVGVSLDDISLWQLQGTPEATNPLANRAVVPGYPWRLGDWGQVDYSVYIDGARKPTLKTLRERCLARP